MLCPYQFLTFFHHRSFNPISIATVVAVNDPFLTPEYAAYQFKYDSVHGIYPAEVTHGEGYLMVGDVKIRFFAERNPAGTLRVLKFYCLL